MTGDVPAEGGGGVDGAARGDGAGRARRRAAAVGDLLPERSGDETGRGWNEREEPLDEEYLRDVPPHHG